MITLINGCSNTVGDDLKPGECWSDLYALWSPNKVQNIAIGGQSNHLICRETIRHLELNREIRSIVVMFTAFYRTEIFKEKGIEHITYHSLNAQRPIPKQSIWWNEHTQKVFKEWFEVQDMRNFQEKDCYDMFCLKQYCDLNNIKYKFLWAYEFPLVHVFLLNNKSYDISTDSEKYYYSNYIGQTFCKDENINLLKFWVHNYANGNYKSEVHRKNGHYSADVHNAFFENIKHTL
jgi:hypothetical protein